MPVSAAVATPAAVRRIKLASDNLPWVKNAAILPIGEPRRTRGGDPHRRSAAGGAAPAPCGARAADAGGGGADVRRRRVSRGVGGRDRRRSRALLADVLRDIMLPDGDDTGVHGLGGCVHVLTH